MIKIRDCLEFISVDIIEGNLDVTIDGLNLCNRDTLKESIASYVTGPHYVESVNNNKAIKCLFVKKDFVDEYRGILSNRNGLLLICEEPEMSFYDFHNNLYERNFYEKYDWEPRIGKNTQIHPSAVICNGTIIGDNVIIGANTVVKAGTIIDDNVEIGCNSVIGSEGFQLIRSKNKNFHIKHIGRTHICENVYIGDNTDICNAFLEGEVYIGENTKIDNLVHIAHNCYIGSNCVITAGSILCGSSTLEDGAWIGVNSSILNKVVIGENALVGIGSVVTRSVPKESVVYGVPAKQKDN